eukprot:997031_1
MKQFVVAYGSLLNSKIRAKYVSEADAMHQVFTIRIKKMIRSWEDEGVRLDVVHSNNERDYINGSIFQISSNQLDKMDQNETSYGFKRCSIQHENIVILNSTFTFNTNDNVWIYQLDHDKKPLFTYLPLNISFEYVRCCLEGYTCYGHEFMLEFIKTTRNWNQCYFRGLIANHYAGHRSISLNDITCCNLFFLCHCRNHLNMFSTIVPSII